MIQSPPETEKEDSLFSFIYFDFSTLFFSQYIFFFAYPKTARNRPVTHISYNPVHTERIGISYPCRKQRFLSQTRTFRPTSRRSRPPGSTPLCCSRRRKSTSPLIRNPSEIRTTASRSSASASRLWCTTTARASPGSRARASSPTFIHEPGTIAIRRTGTSEGNTETSA